MHIVLLQESAIGGQETRPSKVGLDFVCFVQESELVKNAYTVRPEPKGVALRDDDLRAPLEDDKVMQPGSLEGVRKREACRASPNNQNTHAHTPKKKGLEIFVTLT